MVVVRMTPVEGIMENLGAMMSSPEMIAGKDWGRGKRLGRREGWGEGKAGEEGRLRRREGWGRGKAGEEGRG